MPAKKRVLIVDDEVAVGNMLAACCDLWGFEPVVATTGAEALDLMRESAPDLIVTDFMMPGMTGHELTRRARADGRLKDVPVILTSSAPEAAGRDSPADALLPKPFDLDEVEVLLREWLGRSRRARRNGQ
jgi:two-component system phosphate regulon response regulator PhoB